MSRPGSEDLADRRVQLSADEEDRAPGSARVAPVNRAALPAATVAALRAAELILDTMSGELVCDATDVPADLVTVDAVARIALAARRRGRRFRIEAPSRDLVELLGLCGLGELVLGPREGR
jgi:hypothetical protein